MDKLAEHEIRAPHEALDDECHSWTTCDQVIRDFGDVRPFSNTRRAEACHIEALCVLFVPCELPVPEDTWAGRVDRCPSSAAACEAGVAAEITNGELYGRLFEATERPDIHQRRRRLYRLVLLQESTVIRVPTLPRSVAALSSTARYSVRTGGPRWQAIDQKQKDRGASGQSEALHHGQRFQGIGRRGWPCRCAIQPQRPNRRLKND